jgi:hypothetical protein
MGPGSSPIPTVHTTYAIWIQTRSLIEAWRNAPELHGEELEPRPAGMPDRKYPLINGVIDPVSFEAGAAAMREAIATAKYDALQAGRLDLTAFEIRNVPTPKPGEKPPERPDPQAEPARTEWVTIDVSTSGVRTLSRHGVTHKYSGRAKATDDHGLSHIALPRGVIEAALKGAP